MKTTPPSKRMSLLSGFTAATLGSLAFAHATPQLEPEGDIETAEFIQMEIYHDQEMKGADVTLDIKDGIATLTGKAASLAQVERASAKVFANPEVLTVVNMIEIAPIEDTAILARVKEILETQRLVGAEAIKPATEGSRIVLEGEVGSIDEAELVREIVSETPGVTAIDNRLVVNFESLRTDSGIAAQLAYNVNDDPIYAGLDLAPEVKDGVVSWSGQVGTRGEFDRLVRISYVTGVIDVNMQSLTINGDLAMEAVEDKDYTPSQSLEALTVAFENDPRLSASDVSATMNEGVITLKGSVSETAQRDAAELTARCIPGVLEVSNRINVVEKRELASTQQEVTAAAPPVKKAPR